ncbi:hypothetical protein OROMI_030789 [Orobanche minor]
MAFLFLHRGLEAHPFGQIVDPEAIANSHYELLAPYIKSIEKAKRAIFYSYNCFNGFAALIDKGVATDIAQNSNEISVFITGKCTCQTTYSWDFLGLGNKVFDINPRVLAIKIWDQSRLSGVKLVRPTNTLVNIFHAT